MVMEYFDERIRSGVLYICCIFVISVMLENKKPKGIAGKYIFFGVVAVVATIGYEFLYAGIGSLVADYEAVHGGEVTWFGNIMLSLANLIQNMIPGTVVVLAALFLYKEKWEEKVCLTLLVLLVETIVLNVFCEITNLPF